MRVGVMTFLHNDNYGSTLQAWALQQTLRELGCDAEHIDYHPSQKEKIRNLLQSGNSPRLMLEGVRKRMVKASESGARNKSASFAGFYRQHMRLSTLCADQAALKQAAKGYDAVLCGSDQIWSPVWLNPAYFLDFADGKPKAAYAASLGVARMPSGRKAKAMAKLTRDFTAISVREEEGAALLEQITGQRFPVMPDPVCLQPREAWQALAQRPEGRSPYLLCYFIADQPEYWRRVAQIRERTGLDTVVIPVAAGAYRQPYERAEGLSPQQWLGWLEGAAHICTDSFHGAAFAAILGRPMTILRRYREDDPESKNSRVDQLMRSLGITDTEHMNWPEAEARMAALRLQGRKWLEETLAALAGPKASE